MWTYHWNNDIFRESTPPRNLILVSPEQCWHFWTHQFDKIAFQLCYIWYMYIYFYVGIQKYTSVTYNLSCKSYTEVTFWENTLFGISVVMIVSFWDKNLLFSFQSFFFSLRMSYIQAELTYQYCCMFYGWVFLSSKGKWLKRFEWSVNCFRFCLKIYEAVNQKSNIRC